MTESVIEFDVLVIGGGVAGLCAAQEARARGYRTLLVSQAVGDGASGHFHQYLNAYRYSSPVEANVRQQRDNEAWLRELGVDLSSENTYFVGTVNPEKDVTEQWRMEGLPFRRVDDLHRTPFAEGIVERNMAKDPKLQLHEVLEYFFDGEALYRTLVDSLQGVITIGELKSLTVDDSSNVTDARVVVHGNECQIRARAYVLAIGVWLSRVPSLVTGSSIGMARFQDDLSAMGLEAADIPMLCVRGPLLPQLRVLYHGQIMLVSNRRGDETVWYVSVYTRSPFTPLTSPYADETQAAREMVAGGLQRLFGAVPSLAGVLRSSHYHFYLGRNVVRQGKAPVPGIVSRLGGNSIAVVPGLWTGGKTLAPQVVDMVANALNVQPSNVQTPPALPLEQPTVDAHYAFRSDAQWLPYLEFCAHHGVPVEKL